MRHIIVLGLVASTAVGVILVSKGQAADLDPAYPPPPANAEIDPSFEFGTGWYLRGDVGWSDSKRDQLFADLPKLTSSEDWVGGVGAGYRWNNWFRTDLTLNFEGYKESSTQSGTTAQVCPYRLDGLFDQTTGFQYGYLWSPQEGTCSDKERASILKTDVMLNGYVDIGTWAGVTPYVGTGVGFARLDTWKSDSYVKNSDGSTYQADLSPIGTYPRQWVDISGAALVPQPTVPTTGQQVAFAKQNWSSRSHKTQYNFAWALMGGVAYAVDDHLSIDLGYRYVNLGSYRDASGTNKTVDAQQVRLGFRYAID